jgi:hypothetical protein
MSDSRRHHMLSSLENDLTSIQLYSGDKEPWLESLAHVQRASFEMLAAIMPTS